MDYSNYRKFHNIEDSIQITSVLDANNIEYQIVEVKPKVDLTFTGNIDIEYWVQMKPHDIDKYESLATAEALKHLDEINKESYLKDFTNDELIEVLEKFDEWDENDYLYANVLLNQRGIIITEDKLQEYKVARLKLLRTPEKAHWGWLAFAYLSSILGGLLGIVIGLLISSTKKTTPGGVKVHTYDSKSRLHGRLIFFIGIISLIFWVALNILLRL